MEKASHFADAHPPPEIARMLDRQAAISFVGVGTNLVAVTAGNIVGGTLLVAGVYWVAYLRDGRRRDDG
ncbi:MAG TPA: hypothetical protein VMO26_09720 [Vicinamibacterales bacterium]|nr:hypothetical protein [Vicinamibacterales bacterium]